MCMYDMSTCLLMFIKSYFILDADKHKEADACNMALPRRIGVLDGRFACSAWACGLPNRGDPCPSHRP